MWGVVVGVRGLEGVGAVEGMGARNLEAPEGLGLGALPVHFQLDPDRLPW